MSIQKKYQIVCISDSMFLCIIIYIYIWGRAVRQGGTEDQCRGYSRNGLPPVPVSRNLFGGGVQATDDGTRDFLPGDSACLGTLCGVQGGDGLRVAVGPSIDASWEGNGWETALGNHVPRWGAMHIQAGLTNRRWITELPRWGVSGTGGDSDDNVGSFLTQTWRGGD